MQFVLYTLETDPSIRISISCEIDRYFWRQQGAVPVWLTSTRSMGHALAMAQTRRQRIVFSDQQAYMPVDHEWNVISEQAMVVRQLLNGRSLLYTEVKAMLLKRNLEYTERQLYAIIQYLYLYQHVIWAQGVALGESASAVMCNRCFAPRSLIYKTACATCEEMCAVCQQCLLLGRSRACSLLLQFQGQKARETVFVAPPELTLTRAQKHVSENINEFLQSSNSRALVWAVTGAGKTEMMVPSVRSVLSTGGKVLWVTPRKDVVMEIAPRVREFFPEVRSIALYGGSEDAWKEGDLVISTAHQAWRYYNSFDFVIVDEVDAFPLYGNTSLEKGIARSLSSHAKQVYLTATPPENWKRHIERESCLYVLPARYHGHPLPVPHFIRGWFLERKVRLGLSIPFVSRFLHEMKESDGQAFIFVPRTKDVARIVAWFVMQGVEQGEISGVYSQDPERKGKVQKFRAGVTKIIVTTTILERGVTVPTCFVLVWDADHPVFDHASLIQISGRVGRSGAYQQGKVYFLAKEKTESQRRAKKEIKWLNEQAKKAGFLKKEAYYP